MQNTKGLFAIMSTQDSSLFPPHPSAKSAMDEITAIIQRHIHAEMDPIRTLLLEQKSELDKIKSLLEDWSDRAQKHPKSPPSHLDMLDDPVLPLSPLVSLPLSPNPPLSPMKSHPRSARRIRLKHTR